MEKTMGRLGWLFLLLGLGMLAGAGYAASRTAAFLRIATSADGTVVDLTVFVDPANPKRYVVDVDFLPKLAA